MKIFTIANFYFGLMLPPAKVHICKDIIWRNDQSDQSNHMYNPHTYVGWVSNLSEISEYMYIAQYRMKIFIIANFYFGLMLPPAKVDICKDIIWRNGQSDQSNPMYNPHTYAG